MSTNSKAQTKYDLLKLLKTCDNEVQRDYEKQMNILKQASLYKLNQNPNS